MKSKLRVSLVIPAYNEESHLHATLQAIAAQTVKPFEVIVVDNNSSDGTAAIARAFPFVTLLSEPRRGVSHSRNTGFNAARGDIIAKLDAKTRPEPGWIAHLQQVFEDENVDAVSGSAHFYDVALWQIIDKVDWHMRAWIARHMRPVFLWGINTALRRSAWQKVKPHVCASGRFHEDLDLALHLNQEGKKVIYDSSLHVNTSGRRIDTNFLSLLAYIWANDRTYARHGVGISQRKYMYPTMALVVGFYPLLRVLYRGYDESSGKFYFSRILDKNLYPARVDSTINS